MDCYGISFRGLCDKYVEVRANSPEEAFVLAREIHLNGDDSDASCSWYFDECEDDVEIAEEESPEFLRFREDRERGVSEVTCLPHV